MLKVFKTITAVWLCLICITGCSSQLVAPFDLQTVNQIEFVEKKIDFLYRSAQLLPEGNRQYEKFSAQYMEIEVDIRELLRRQERRENNSEKTRQVAILLELWTQDRSSHQEKNTLSDFIIKRRIDQYQRMFTALIKSENAKK